MFFGEFCEIFNKVDGGKDKFMAVLLATENVWWEFGLEWIDFIWLKL